MYPTVEGTPCCQSFFQVAERYAATFRGYEAQGKLRVLDHPGTLDLLGQVSYVKAFNRTRASLFRVSRP